MQKSSTSYQTELRLRAHQWKWMRFVKSLDQTNNQINNINHKLAWLESFVEFYVQKSTTSYQTELRLRARQWKWTRFVKSPASKGALKNSALFKTMQLLDPRCQSKTRSYSTKSSPVFIFYFYFLFFKTHFYFLSLGKIHFKFYQLLISKTSTRLSFFLINYHKKNTMRVCKKILRGNFLEFRIWLLLIICD